MASGCACMLHRSGFFRILMTEIDRPRAVRRRVSFCEAVHEARWTVEGVTAERIDHVELAQDLWEKRLIPVLMDPEASTQEVLKPDVLLDAVLAKRNLGTGILDAPLAIALGPGFGAGKDAHYVIETYRGHNLARFISHGSASPGTGVPAEIGGHSVLRVLRSPADGVFQSDSFIGMQVTEGQVLGHVSGEPVRS